MTIARQVALARLAAETRTDVVVGAVGRQLRAIAKARLSARSSREIGDRRTDAEVLRVHDALKARPLTSVLSEGTELP